MILATQAGLILMSYVISLYPQYFWPIYILYIIIFFGITSAISLRSNPILSERKYLPEILNSRILFEEKRAGDLIQKDQEYLSKLQEFVSSTFKFFIYMILYLIIISILYYEILMRIVSHEMGYERLLTYIVYFEALFLFNMFAYGRIIKPRTLEVVAPQSYRVTEKGIISTDRSVYLHSRHLINAEIIDNREKKYVEIRSNTLKLPYRIRLYTTEIDRLLEVLERVKKLEIKRQQSSST